LFSIEIWCWRIRCEIAIIVWWSSKSFGGCVWPHLGQQENQCWGWV